MYKESHFRSVLKTISWRFWATLTTVALVLLFTGQTTIALSIGGLEVILKMIIYFFHERAWNRVKFGRHEIQPFVLWFTGLPSSGKNEISQKVVEKLSQNGIKVEYLNGQTVRKLFPETGFSKEGINEHIKRIGYLASQLEKHGIFVVASFISPYKESREFVKKICKNFLEIHVDTPLEYCMKRDKEGLYRLAKEGKVKNLVGVDAPYEKPESPFLRVDLSKESSDQISDKILNQLKKYL